MQILLICFFLTKKHGQLLLSRWLCGAGRGLLQEEAWEAEVGMKPGKFPKQMGRDGPEWGASHLPLTPDGLRDFVNPARDLFPEYFPGDVIDELDFRVVDEALDDVMMAGELMHDRRCAQSASNEGSKTLVNPRWYLSSGLIHSVPGAEVKTNQSGLNLFLKTPWTLRGTVGVVSYDIRGTEFKLAIMWSVPYDRNLYDNWFNMKIYPQSFATDEDMYDQMYYYAGPWLPQGWEDRTEYSISLRGAMTDNPDGQPEQWADCSYHAGWVRNYCWRECTPRGWCWVDQRCSSWNDCQGGPLPCYTECRA